MNIYRSRGYTLFELLVSISIIAILTALATVSYSNAQKKARDAKRMDDIKMVANAAELYYSLGSYSYPGNRTTPWTYSSQTVMEAFPKDPKTGNMYDYNILGGTQFCVCATLESNNGNASSVMCNDFGTGGSTYFCAKGQQ